MRAVRSRHTTPERVLRKALHRNGLRFRLRKATLPGTPDIVFSGLKVALFVDGDFWHGHQWRLRGLPSLESQFATNADYWTSKIRRNMDRDERVDAELKALGWRPIRVRESDIRSSIDTVIHDIAELLEEVRSKTPR